MNGFEVTHPWNRTDDTVLLVYNTSMDTNIFTFGLPGQCDRLVTDLVVWDFDLGKLWLLV